VNAERHLVVGLHLRRNEGVVRRGLPLGLLGRRRPQHEQAEDHARACDLLPHHGRTSLSGRPGRAVQGSFALLPSGFTTATSTTAGVTSAPSQPANDSTTLAVRVPASAGARTGP